MTIKKFVVLVPVYNKINYLEKFWECLEANRIFIDKVIFCDDSSTDGSLEFLQKRLSDSKFSVSLVVNPENLGEAKTRQRLLQMSKGNFIAWCDPDDFWTKNHLENLASLVRMFPNAICSTRSIKRSGSTGLVTFHSGLKNTFCNMSNSAYFNGPEDIQLPNLKLGADYFLWMTYIIKQKRIIATIDIGTVTVESQFQRSRISLLLIKKCQLISSLIKNFGFVNYIRVRLSC